MTHNEAAFYAMEALKKEGAEKAACRASTSRKDEFNIEANKFTLMRTLFNDNLHLKAVKDGRKGVININRLDRDSIDGAVNGCIALAQSAMPDECEDIAEKSENKNFNRSIGGADMDRLFARSKEFLEALKDEYPKIMLESMGSEFNTSKTIYVNSNGAEFTDESENYSFNTMFSAKEGEKASSFNGYFSCLGALEKPFIELDLHRTLLDESQRSIDTRGIDKKFTGKIIVTPACDDMIWQTIVSCFLSDSSLIEGTSRWKDSLGKKVADSKLTMRASPLNPHIIAGERFTGDGYESQNADFIREGILTSFALSLYGAKKTGKPRALNTAFGNIEVMAGDTPLDDMIKSVDCGILINRFSGGMPGPGGDISGVAKNSFLIENGCVTDALKETMVSFNIIDVLSNITAISKERSCNGWTILPWCCFDGVTIS